jgi:hypothetical protein
MLSYILARLKEPSTYAGIGTVAGLVGLHLSGAQVSAITDICVVLAGAAAAFVPESTTVAK